MTEPDRESYRRQFAAAQKRLPRGHVIHHCTWRDGLLLTLSAKPERTAAPPVDQVARVSRGVQGTLL